MTRLAFCPRWMEVAQNACLNLASGLLARGFTVDLVLARSQGALLWETCLLPPG